ncbi:endonuclease Q family protein [Paenibacillus aurantius]|uniref:Endonuclease Q family protein n=1 Tax=Paenibacillus aurantius TaxID=2918900 RepID=A0AA96LA58_9BACL|nr:endonuclease Q family protein [Paenibacillus aurantius]WNQ09364.1 endonuclease Q family protein [Paenibacillus aurantius]
MKSYYVDLHVHIGRTEKGSPVKISAARNLTFYNIAKEASERKGIEVVGIIDSHSPSVQEEIEHYLDNGEMTELEGGGIRYHDTTILLGSEIEVRDPGMGPAHLLVYLPRLADMKAFTGWLRLHMKNVDLSSQRIYVPARVLQQEVLARGGIVIPAHIFTPHKSIYGSCSSRMADLLDLDGLAAVELGLSSDTGMAGCLSELDRLAFVTNSDAHSLGKIGREYNRMRLESPSYREVVLALRGEQGRAIEANYGLNPRLGKYHRTYCGQCESILDEAGTAVERCLNCGSTKIVRGVMDRIEEISDREEPDSSIPRPPYQYQVPLEFIPGLGPKLFDRLLDRFGTEMAILHQASREGLAEVAGEAIAGLIVQAREGTLRLDAGGGGRYGKVSR